MLYGFSPSKYLTASTPYESVSGPLTKTPSMSNAKAYEAILGWSMMSFLNFGGFESMLLLKLRRWGPARAVEMMLLPRWLVSSAACLANEVKLGNESTSWSLNDIEDTFFFFGCGFIESMLSLFRYDVGTGGVESISGSTLFSLVAIGDAVNGVCVSVVIILA